MNPRKQETDPLARWADKVLTQLPDRPAPAGFATQVLAELRRRAALPWYKRPWLAWPKPHKWLSLIAFATLIFALLGPGIPAGREALLDTSWGTKAGLAIEQLDAIPAAATALGRVLRAGLAQVSATHVAILAALVAALWASTVGLGAACWRIASQPR